MGKVTLVGAGPGDPELLTLKALRALKEADVVLYDRLVPDEILEMTKARKVYVGKEHGYSENQVMINRLMVEEARQGRRVVRLKNGDPFIFGRGGEEAEFLRESGIPFEVVPGITSAFAGPAYAGVPLTHRRFSSSIAILTGHEDHSKDRPKVRWSELGRAVDTLVILMGVRNLERIVGEVRRGGLTATTEVAIVEWASTKKQRVITGNLGNIVVRARKEGLSPPAIIVIGKTARLAKKLAWFPSHEKSPEARLQASLR